MENILNVQTVEKYYGNKENVTKALDNISFKVQRGEFVGIMGPSGSGKTTLLNCISTIDKVTTGAIVIDEDDITRLKNKKLEKFRRDKLGFIFQDFNLLDTLTAYENIALTLTIGGKKGNEVAHRMRTIPALKNIPLVLMTAFSLSEAEKAEFQTRDGVDAVISKPLPAFDVLQSTLNRIIQNKNLDQSGVNQSR